jgi:hypothetical protein
MDPVPDPLRLRKSGSAGTSTRVLWVCSQELWPLDLEMLYLCETQKWRATVVKPPEYECGPTPLTWILLEKLIVAQIIKYSPTFHGARIYFIFFTRVHHWPLICARWIQSKTFHLISLRYTLILSFPLCLVLSAGLIPSGFPTKPLNALVLHACYMSGQSNKV